MTSKSEIRIAPIVDIIVVNRTESRLLQKIKTVVGTGSLSPENIVGIVIDMMTLAEDPTWNLSGKKKKELVIKVIGMYVDKEVDDEQTAMILKLLIQSTVPSLIDSIVSVSKGEIAIKVKSCLSKCFPCC